MASSRQNNPYKGLNYYGLSQDMKEQFAENSRKIKQEELDKIKYQSPIQTDLPPLPFRLRDGSATPCAARDVVRAGELGYEDNEDDLGFKKTLFRTETPPAAKKHPAPITATGKKTKNEHRSKKQKRPGPEPITLGQPSSSPTTTTPTNDDFAHYLMPSPCPTQSPNLLAPSPESIVLAQPLAHVVCPFCLAKPCPHKADIDLSRTRMDASYYKTNRIYNNKNEFESNNEKRETFRAVYKEVAIFQGRHQYSKNIPTCVRATIQWIFPTAIEYYHHCE
jgi:hypothetical protein